MVSFVVILIIVIVVYCLYRRRQNLGKINPSPPSTPDEDSEVKYLPEKDTRYIPMGASPSRSSLQERDGSAFRRPTPMAFTDPEEPAFEEKEEQFWILRYVLCYRVGFEAKKLIGLYLKYRAYPFARGLKG